MTNSDKLSTPPKHIGRRAGKIFTYHLPDHWVIRSQEDQEDYGVDYEIQLGLEHADVVTEDIFKIQLKGINEIKENDDYFDKGDYAERKKLKYSLKVDKFRHYANLEIPVFLVVVLIDKKEIFWINLQDNAQIIGKDGILNKKAQQDTATIYLTKKFDFDDEGNIEPNELIKKYQEVCNFLWSRKDREGKLSEYSENEIDRTINVLENKLFSFILQKYKNLESDDNKKRLQIISFLLDNDDNLLEEKRNELEKLGVSAKKEIIEELNTTHHDACSLRGQLLDEIESDTRNEIYNDVISQIEEWLNHEFGTNPQKITYNTVIAKLNNMRQSL